MIVAEALELRDSDKGASKWIGTPPETETGPRVSCCHQRELGNSKRRSKELTCVRESHVDDACHRSIS